MPDAIPTSAQTITYGFAPEVAPYAQGLLGAAFGNVFKFGTQVDPNTGLPTITGMQPYMQYQGERQAQFSPLQQQAFVGAQQMAAAPQLQDASAMAGTAGLKALGYGYTPGTFTTQSLTAPGVADQYMNPYMSAVQQQLQRSADIQRQQIGAQAAQAGAFGGARSGLMNQQLNAELMRQQGQAQAQAFNQAQQQFNQEQAQRMQAQQLAEQSRQYGAGIGLQGLQTGLQAAQQLGALGQTQYGQEMGINQLQAQYGLQQQQQMQNILNQQYQDYLNYQNYPYKQLGFFSDILRGVPLTQTGSQLYQAPPTALQTLTGVGLGAAGISNLVGIKEGGEVKSYADGGSVMSPGFKRYAVDTVDPRSLPMVQRNAVARGDLDTVQAAMEQMARDAAIRRGVAAALPPGADVVRAAGGGIIAFAAGGMDKETDALRAQIDAADKEYEGYDDGDRITQNMVIRAAMDASRRAAERDSVPEDTPEELARQRQVAFEQLVAQAGPSPITEFLKKYKTNPEEIEGQRRQDVGVALLEAAERAVQPGGTVRGIAGAGAALGKGISAANKARRQEQMAMDRMQAELLDAQRKERMGLSREASALVESARKSKVDAARYKGQADRLEAETNARLAMALRPHRPTSTGAEKPELVGIERLAQSYIARGMDPKAAYAQATLNYKAASAGTTAVPRTMADARKALKEYMVLSPEAWQKAVKAAGGEEAATNTFLDNYMSGALPATLQVPPAGRPAAPSRPAAAPNVGKSNW